MTLLGEGTFINKHFTWGGDVNKEKIWGGTLIKKKFTCGGDVCKQKIYLGMGRL